ncbi:MAG: SGNH/GDSL hydrolase family protein [Candidatus Saccharimonadales bacterium]
MLDTKNSVSHATHDHKKKAVVTPQGEWTAILATIGILCILAAGLWLTLSLRPNAATPTTADLQAENGTLSSGTIVGNDVNASGGRYVLFAQPTPTAPIKLMPLGDSITLGWNYYPGTSLPAPGGYRTLLWQKLVQQDGKNIDFVGTLSSGPPELSDKNHEGHSGERIDQIRASIDTYLASAQPDVVLLTIGTNDVLQNYSISAAPARLQDLVDRICTTRLNTRIVVSTIPPRPGLDSRVNTYNAAIPGVVTASQNKGCKTTYFNMNSYMVSSDLASSDNTHPTMAGYDKMAEAWYPVVTGLYNNR